MSGTTCPWCHQRFGGFTCPNDRWDSRYGNIKEGCCFSGCRRDVTLRSVDHARPVEYRTMWCELHRPKRDIVEPLTSSTPSRGTP